MKRNYILLISILFVLGTSVGSWADHYGGFDISDAETVHDAVTEIEEALMDQNFEITAVIDHAQNAASVGLDLPPTQVVLFRIQRGRCCNSVPAGRYRFSAMHCRITVRSQCRSRCRDTCLPASRSCLHTCRSTRPTHWSGC